MWRVLFRIRGADEDWNTYETEGEAWEFAHGLLASDKHELLDRLRLERSVEERWRIEFELLDKLG